jgi:hypothetical protein
MHGGGSLMWMASVRSGGRIFAIATTPKSEKPQLVGLSSFAKSTAVTTDMGTTQIEGLAARAARQREAEENLGREVAMTTTRTHFTCRVDAWTPDGESIVEHVAGVEDYRSRSPPTAPPANAGLASPPHCA